MRVCKTLFSAMYLIALSSLTFAQSELEYTGSCLWNGARDIVIEGNHAYLATASGLAVFDISDPAHPDSVAFLFEIGECLEVQKSGDFLYLPAGRAGLIIVDVSIPSKPTNSAVYSLGDDVDRMTIDGSTALVDTRSKGTFILDLTNPTAPDSVGWINLLWYAGHLADTLFYAGYRGLTIYNVSDPANPVVVAPFDVDPNLYFDLALIDTLLYAGLQNRTLKVFNVADPTAPDSVGSVVLQSIATHLNAQNSILYASSGRSVHSIDVSNPAAPSLLGTHKSSSRALGIMALNDTVFAAEEGDLLMEAIDFSTPANPVAVGQYESPSSYVYDISVRDGYGYVASEGGLRILDVANPQAPHEIGSAYLWGKLRDVAIRGDLAFVARVDTTFILDLRSSSFPLLIGKVNASGNISGKIKLTDSLAFLPYSRGVILFDIANPASLDSVTTIPVYAYAHGVDYDAPLVYYATGDGLEIANITDPFNPQNLGVYWTDDEGLCVTVRGAVAFLGTDGAGLYIIDVSDPLNPDTLSTVSYGVNNEVSNVFLQDSILYATWPRKGLTAININDPASPVIVSEYSLPNFPNGLFVKDSVVFVAGMYSLQLFTTPFFTDIQTGVEDESGLLPDAFSVSQNFPNPFNPRTTIEYTLSAKATVTVEIFNTLGQRVRALLHEMQSAGPHRITWDGSDDIGNALATGVYFYRIKAGEQISSRKMLLLK